MDLPNFQGDLPGGTIAVHSDREAWLNARRQGIGASDSAVLFNQGFAGTSPYSLYVEKCTGSPVDESEKAFLNIGLLMESALRSVFSHVTGHKVVPVAPHSTYQSRTKPFMFASLDGLMLEDGKLGVLELKNCSVSQRAEWKDGEGPLKYQIQVQHQLFVTGLDFAFLFGLVGGNEPFFIRIERNDTFINDVLLPACESFWKHVESGTPPAIDGAEGTRKALFALHPEDNGETVDLGVEFLDLDKELQGIKDQIKDLESREKIIENEIREKIGDATFGNILGVIEYSWKTQNRKSYVVEAGSSRVLRRKLLRK